MKLQLNDQVSEKSDISYMIAMELLKTRWTTGMGAPIRQVFP
jgi:hypothetical protein